MKRSALSAFTLALTLVSVVAQSAHAGQMQAERVCEKSTAGTCFAEQCYSSRGNTTCAIGKIQVLGSTLSLPWPWLSCDCVGGECAGIDGACHPHTFPTTVASRLRSGSQDIAAMLVFLLGRTGAKWYIMRTTGLNKIFGFTKTMPTFYSTRKTWEVLQNEQELSLWQACLVGVAKLSCWHLLQIAWFVLTFYAYSPLMSQRQRIFAVLVVVKEALYAVVLVCGVVMAPKFLLFSPASDQSRVFRVAYILSPDAFVADTLSMSISNRLASTLFQMVTLLSATLSLASWVALSLGFADGAMTFALACGYVLSGLTPVGLMVTNCCLTPQATRGAPLIRLKTEDGTPVRVISRGDGPTFSGLAGLERLRRLQRLERASDGPSQPFIVLDGAVGIRSERRIHRHRSGSF